MLEKLKRAGDTVFTWSDEKILRVEATVNRQNDRVYAAVTRGLPESSTDHFVGESPPG